MVAAIGFMARYDMQRYKLFPINIKVESKKLPECTL